MAELNDRPEYCLDLTFMYSLLSLGYELDEERQIWMGKKVSDVELGWCVLLLLICFALSSLKHRQIDGSTLSGHSARRSP